MECNNGPGIKNVFFYYIKLKEKKILRNIILYNYLLEKLNTKLIKLNNKYINYNNWINYLKE